MPLDLGFLIFLAIVAAGVGRRVLDAIGMRPEDPADAWALSVPLGLGGLALAVLGLGVAGRLTPGSIGLAMVIGLVVGGKAGWDATAGVVRGIVRDRGRDGVGRAFDWLFAATAAGSLATALAPVTDGDALCYHLQVPKVFLAAGGATFEPDLHETVYPLSVEMLYAVALALRGPVACRLVQWLLGIVFAANVAALARPILGTRARWAATIALLVPAVSNGMGAPLNDVALAAFGNAAIFAWMRHRDRPSMASALLAGAFAGLAIGVKYPGLVLLGVLGLGMLLGPGGIRVRIKHALMFGGMAVLVGGGWYLRAYLHTGNPVFPFFRQVFGGAGLDEVLDPAKKAMVPTAWNVLTALGPMTLQPGRFDSFSHQFGPMFLLFLPALIWERPPRRVWVVVLVGYAFLSLCLTQRQSMRFVLTAVGPMAVGVGWLASTWRDRRTIPAQALVGILLLALGFEASLAVARARTGLGVVLGRESADSHLTRREPTYPVGRWIDAHLPGDARLVGQDHRGFYIPRPYSMELAHRRRTGLGRHGESADGVVEALRGAGFTHVLLCPPVPEHAVEFDPTLGRLLAPWLATHEPVYRRDLSDADGVTRRYAIYSIRAEEGP
ncbi:ArnT family glycosyltransferase [Tundrisphaera sp. TA3]|uniref:ArnT family glycosyltransferase n=1 Tax=Tundrisphaera sp. TA3 TaxID=3435775 RepID=UPI003EC0D6F6